ncbi:recombinase family protein, partial [Waltera sp.]|uniref:recombinase family protein n=1 Tax=Waltera sp. TaxID=2815806 RepID=UPI00307E2EDB
VQMEALDVQVAYTRKLVEDNHLTIVDQYIEPETGTEAEHRLEYQRMIRDIKADRIDLVVVKCSDRLCRDQAEWHNFVKLHLQKKFQLYFYLDDHIYDHERDDIKYSVQAIVDAEQSKITSKKIRDIHSNRQIYATGSKALHICRPLYGWDRNVEFIDENTKRVWWTVNEKEATELRYALSLVEQGIGFYRLANIMYDRGVRSKGTTGYHKMPSVRIAANTWKKMLTSPMLHGDCILHKEVSNFYTKERVKLPQEDWIYKENVIPPIVSREYHEKIVQIIDARRFRMGCCKGLAGTYKWSNRLVCANCKKPYYRMHYKFNSERVITWKCSEQFQRTRSACDNMVIAEKELEKQMAAALKEKYAYLFHISSGLINDTIHTIEKALCNSDNGKKLKALETQHELLLRNKDVLFHKLMNGVISDEDFGIYKDRLEKELRELEEKIEGQKDGEKSLADQYRRLQQIRDTIENKNYNEQAILEILYGCVEVIEIHNNGDMDVTMSRELMRSKFELYSIVESDYSLFYFSFTYKKETIYDRNRKAYNEKVLELIRSEKYITIPQMAERLGNTYSYTWHSIQQLKEQGRIVYIKEKFEHSECYWEVVE